MRQAVWCVVCVAWLAAGSARAESNAVPAGASSADSLYAQVEVFAERVRGLGKPILATGGGGYNIENTVRG